MLHDIYVREKLREIGQPIGEPPRPPLMIDAPSELFLLVRSMGRLLCRMGERLQSLGARAERRPQGARLREPGR
jgi:hypothetical protein